jgi:hypothetical protein
MKHVFMASVWIVAIALVILGLVQPQKMTALQTAAVDAEAIKTELAASVAEVEALEQQRDTPEASLAKVEPTDSTLRRLHLLSVGASRWVSSPTAPAASGALVPETKINAASGATRAVEE